MDRSGESNCPDAPLAFILTICILPALFIGDREREVRRFLAPSLRFTLSSGNIAI
jgi:hypothetical protein